MARILIVDDDPSIVETFSRLLTIDDHDIFTATDVESALGLVATSHLDAVLVDLRMPVADGMTFLRRLRADENAPRLPVALMTGDYSLDKASEREVEALAAELHFKPMWLEDLQRILKSLLGEKTMNATLSDRTHTDPVKQAIESLLGYGSLDRPDGSVFDLIHPDDVARVRALFDGCLITGRPTTQFRFRCRHATLGWRDVEATGYRFAHEAGEAVGIVCCDITERSSTL